MIGQRLPHISRDYIILIILVPVLAVLPMVSNPNRFLMTIATFTLLWALLGTAWNIMAGYAGQFSFGHAAFYGIGAYTSTVLFVDYRISPWIGMLVGAALAGLFGLLMGYLSFRYGLKGPYFALATFAFAEMLRLIANELAFINTSVGIHIPVIRRDSWLGMQFEVTPGNYYYVILGLLTLGLFVNILIAQSKLGYYLQAIREDEDAAAALGVNLLRYKVTAVVVSAALTALAGSFFFQFSFFVSPRVVFGVAVSVGVLMRPIVGGIGTIWGPLIGAIFLTPLGEFTRAFVRTPPPFLSFIEGHSGVDVMIFGAILIVVIIFMPDGIVGAGKRLWERIKQTS